MRIFTLHLCILVTCAVLKDVASLEHKLTLLQKIGVENTKPIFCSKLSHRLLCYTLAMRRERERERDREGSQYLFYFVAVFPPSLFVEMHPGFLLWITQQQTHHFVTIFSVQAETIAPRLFWRGQAESYLTVLPMKSQNPFCGVAVCYTWSWQKSLPLQHPERAKAF